MRDVFCRYREIVQIVANHSPMLLILTFAASIIRGLLPPLSMYVNSNIISGGMAIAEGTMSYANYAVYIVLLIVISLLPAFVGELLIYGYVQPKVILIIRSHYKDKMIIKLKNIKYEHFESEASAEIIDKAFSNIENSIRNIFPNYIYWSLSAIIASIGLLASFAVIRWWMVLTILVPFILETFVLKRASTNIYEELDKYWKREKMYTSLSDFLKTRNYITENRLNGAAGYLIGVYKERFHKRNKEYEKFYFKNLKRNLMGYHITNVSIIIHAIILMLLFLKNALSIASLIPLTLAMFSSTYQELGGTTVIFRASGYHLKVFSYIDAFFEMEEREIRAADERPERLDIEFRDVHFTYPGTDREILKGFNLHIRSGEKISIIGRNSEGKSTLIKLLLGLFEPTKGMIYIGGRPLNTYTRESLQAMFGVVMQDYVKYSVSLYDNIALGNIENIGREDMISAAAEKAKVDSFARVLVNGYDTILGRDFQGSVDISGGQWQRIAIARAFCGDKPIMILDEPTSQLDPMAESNLYHEFTAMMDNKTAILITHRLASTMITDRIVVLADGIAQEIGTHDDLMARKGLYHKMFESQRKWYSTNGECKEGNYEDE